MGPLHGLRMVELAGIGPAPFAAMLLADMGAEIIRIDRPEPAELGLPDPREPKFDVLNRGRRSIAIDLKHAAGRSAALRLIAGADALLEGFRPGVTERLGLGPDACFAANPRLVYGRVTGFGQDGPFAQQAGHDINYIALSGALSAIGRDGERPAIPLNLVGDFGGGGMVLAFGVLAAVMAAQRDGKGQVVDAAMVDGAAYLMSMIYGFASAGLWHDRRGFNRLDGGAPWYDVYETADGLHVAVGAIEGRFYAALLRGLGLDAEPLPDQQDRAGWPILRRRFTVVFRSRKRADWEAIFAGTDACVTPVLSLSEAPEHPHNIARRTFHVRDGVTEPAPVPRFSRTPASLGALPREAGADSRQILADWGFQQREIDELVAMRVVNCTGPA